MKIFVAMLLALSLSATAAAASVEDDVGYYTKVFAEGGSFDAQAVKSLAWKGISDPRVFDLIEHHALAEAEQGHSDRHVRDEVGLYLRALGFSGQPKYLPTLQKFSTDKTYERYARDAMEELPEYQRWNPVIANRATFDPKYSDDVNRVLNMLHSDDFALKTLGAKRVYFQDKDPVLLDTLAEQIRATYTINDARSNTVAWMVKALGSAKQDKYRPLLQQVAAGATNRAVIRHADKALEG